ncbi:hypothetical protein FQZ97_879690 [compost metagenome]
MFLEVNRRYAVRADGRRGEVDHDHAELVELAAVLRMHIGRGGIEGDADIVVQHMGQQAVDTLGSGLQAEFRGALEAFGCRVDAHHPDRLDPLRAAHLDQQVGTNVARPDNGRFQFLAHLHSPGIRRRRTPGRCPGHRWSVKNRRRRGPARAAPASRRG